MTASETGCNKNSCLSVKSVKMLRKQTWLDLDFERIIGYEIIQNFKNYPTLHKKGSFPLRISSVNVTKSVFLKKSLMENFNCIFKT